MDDDYQGSLASASDDDSDMLFEDILRDQVDDDFGDDGGLLLLEYDSTLFSSPTVDREPEPEARSSMPDVIAITRIEAVFADLTAAAMSGTSDMAIHLSRRPSSLSHVYSGIALARRARRICFPGASQQEALRFGQDSTPELFPVFSTF